jgi:hypothetical protein
VDLPDDDELLTTYADTADGQRYWLRTEPYERDRDDILAVIKACLLLGQPVTATLTAQSFYEVVRRLDALETRLG